jgi:hypothetical protein
MHSEECDTVVVVLSISSVKCHGGSQEYTVLPWAILQRNQIRCEFPEPFVRRLEIGDQQLPSFSLAPDPPPPKHAFAAA